LESKTADIYESSDPLRWELEARSLASDLASRSPRRSLSVFPIEWYEGLFFRAGSATLRGNNCLHDDGGVKPNEL
jgi:hypothetical protein